MKRYDYLVVGSGLYGAIFAHEAKVKGKSVLVVDKRPNIAGNVYTEKQEGINVHMYGAHIFHTNNKKVWNYITQFAEFNRFTNKKNFYRAIKKATGDIIFLADQDDEWYDFKVKTMVKKMIMNPQIMALNSSLQLIDEKSNQIKIRLLLILFIHIPM